MLRNCLVWENTTAKNTFGVQSILCLVSKGKQNCFYFTLVWGFMAEEPHYHWNYFYFLPILLHLIPATDSFYKAGLPGFHLIDTRIPNCPQHIPHHRSPTRLTTHSSPKMPGVFLIHDPCSSSLLGCLMPASPHFHIPER